MPRRLFALTLLALLISTGTALANDAAAAPSPEPAAPTAEQCQPADLAEGTLDPRGSALELSTFCRATCANGSTISYTCNGTCSATDQVCSGGSQTVQGKVTCNGSTVRTCSSSLCDTSNTCTASTTCPDGTPLQCSSSSGDCVGGNGTCFVGCDGVYQWCPGHEGKFLCDLS